MAKKTVNLGGKQLAGEVVPFKTVEEPWCVYECADGTKIRIKLVVLEIVRIEDAFGPEGDPVYTIKSTSVVNTDAPDELRRKPPAGGDQSGNYV